MALDFLPSYIDADAPSSDSFDGEFVLQLLRAWATSELLNVPRPSTVEDFHPAFAE
jgi:hypothetical protein